jgi:hypothetical protein
MLTVFDYGLGLRIFPAQLRHPVAIGSGGDRTNKQFAACYLVKIFINVMALLRC